MSTIANSKEELLQAIEAIFPKLVADYHAIPEAYSRIIGIKGNSKETEISVCDTVAYLIGWGQLVLKWHRLDEKNSPIDFPETGYKWNQLGQLALHFYDQYHDWEYSELLNEFEKTVEEIVQLITGLDNETLYGSFWYRKYSLGRMIQLNTSAPMKNMRTKIRRFSREHKF